MDRVGHCGIAKQHNHKLFYAIWLMCILTPIHAPMVSGYVPIYNYTCMPTHSVLKPVCYVLASIYPHVPMI